MDRHGPGRRNTKRSRFHEINFLEGLFDFVCLYFPASKIVASLFDCLVAWPECPTAIVQKESQQLECNLLVLIQYTLPSFRACCVLARL